MIVNFNQANCSSAIDTLVDRNVGVGDFRMQISIGVNDRRMDISRLLVESGIGILRNRLSLVLVDSDFIFSSLTGIGTNASNKQCR